MLIVFRLLDNMENKMSYLSLAIGVILLALIITGIYHIILTLIEDY